MTGTERQFSFGPLDGSLNWITIIPTKSQQVLTKGPAQASQKSNT